MRKWLVVLSVFAVSGCGLFGPDKIGGDEGATKMGAYYRTIAGMDPASIKCDGVDAEVGAKASCTATDRYGDRWPMTAVVDKVDGDRVTYGTSFRDQIADNDTVQKSVAMSLKTKTGSDFKAVECTGLQKLAVNASRTCTATETNGSRWEVEHYLTNLDGGAEVTLKDPPLYAKTVESIVQSLAQNLSKHYGIEKKGPLGRFQSGSGSCPNMLRGKPDEAVQCKAILADNSSTDVTVSTTKLEDGRIYFQLFPNNAPDLSMSGWQLADPN